MLDDPKVYVTLAILAIWYLIARTDPKYDFHFNPKYWLRMVGRPSEQTLVKLVVCLAVVIVLFQTMPAITRLATDVSGAPIVDAEENVFVDIIEVSPWLLLLPITIMPIFEEWIFRGVILDRIAAKASMVLGLIVSSGLFALLHFVNEGFTMWATLAPLFAGVVLGVVFLAYGLRWSILVHVLYNVAIWVAIFAS